MPQFSAGEQRIAAALLSNPTMAAFDYVANLYLGADAIAIAQQPVHLESKESKSVSFAIVMPMEAKTYPVYMDILSGGALLVHYRASEDVMVTVEYGLLTFTWYWTTEEENSAGQVFIIPHSQTMTLRQLKDAWVECYLNYYQWTYWEGQEGAAPWVMTGEGLNNVVNGMSILRYEMVQLLSSYGISNYQFLGPVPDYSVWRQVHLVPGTGLVIVNGVTI